MSIDDTQKEPKNKMKYNTDGTFLINELPFDTSPKKPLKNVILLFEKETILISSAQETKDWFTHDILHEFMTQNNISEVTVSGGGMVYTKKGSIKFVGDSFRFGACSYQDQVEAINAMKENGKCVLPNKKETQPPRKCGGKKYTYDEVKAMLYTPK